MRDQREQWAWLYEPVDHRDPEHDAPHEIEGYRQNKLRFVLRDAAR